jgi:hypothetical protein
MSNSIPNYYRVLFHYLDPVGLLLGSYIYFFHPDGALAMLIPNASRNPQHDILFYQMTGFLMGYAWLHIVLLRYTDDVNVWRILEVAALFFDAFHASGTIATLSGQGRLNPSTWRLIDWAMTSFVVFISSSRIAFVISTAPDDSKASKKRA